MILWTLKPQVCSRGSSEQAVCSLGKGLAWHVSHSSGPASIGEERPALLTGGAAVVSPGWRDGFACPHSLVSRRAPHVPTPTAFLWGRLPPWQVCPPCTASPRASHQFIRPHHSFSSALALTDVQEGAEWGWILRADSMVVHTEKAVWGP